MRYVLALILALAALTTRASASDPLLTLMNSIVRQAEGETAATYGLVFHFAIEDPCNYQHVVGELRRSQSRLVHTQWLYISTCGVLDAESSAQFLQRLIEVSPSNVQVRLINGQTLYYGYQPAALVKGRIEGDW